MANNNNSECLLNQLNLRFLILEKRGLIRVSSNTSVDNTLKILQGNNILAVPVYDEETKEYRGLVTILDIMAYVAYFSFPISNEDDEEDEAQFKAFKAGTQPIVDLINVHQDSEAENNWIFKDTDSIGAILEPMSKGVHRILVEHKLNLNDSSNKDICDSKEELESLLRTRLITQTDIIRFLLSYGVYETEDSEQNIHLNIFKSLTDLDMEKWIVKKDMVTIKDTDSALTGFRKLVQHSVKCAPVVGEDGQIVGALSGSDLRGLYSDILPYILKPVLEYKQFHANGGVSSDNLSASQNLINKQRFAAISVTMDATLHSVMVKMIINKIHQIFVVESSDNLKPIGVISMTDVIYQFFDHYYQSQV